MKCVKWSFGAAAFLLTVALGAGGAGASQYDFNGSSQPTVLITGRKTAAAVCEKTAAAVVCISDAAYPSFV